MAEPENIEQFKVMAGRILAALYSTHPRAQDFDPSLVFGGNVVPDTDDEELFEETVNSLVENGYIIIVQKGYLRLLDKAYETLQKPNPLDPKKSIGSTLVGWAKDATTKAAKDASSKIVAAALTMLFQAISSASGAA